jgi:hypothetical protein
MLENIASVAIATFTNRKYEFTLFGVGIAAGYGLNGRETAVRFPAASTPALRPTQPPIQ